MKPLDKELLALMLGFPCIPKSKILEVVDKLENVGQLRPSRCRETAIRQSERERERERESKRKRKSKRKRGS